MINLKFWEDILKGIKYAKEAKVYLSIWLADIIEFVVGYVINKDI